jgi:hypothetical protein
MPKSDILLKEFAEWVEDYFDIDLSSYDQDTTPYEVWEFLHCSSSQSLYVRLSQTRKE